MDRKLHTMDASSGQLAAREIVVAKSGETRPLPIFSLKSACVPMAISQVSPSLPEAAVQRMVAAPPESEERSLFRYDRKRTLVSESSLPGSRPTASRDQSSAPPRQRKKGTGNSHLPHLFDGRQL